MGLHLLYSKHMEKFLTKKIRLRPRLQAAADMINGSHLAADIGCDHGRLSVALLQQGRADRVIASDISAPSLQKATELAALCGLGSRLTTVLSDGMAHLGPDEADAIAICGMGGELIARILEANLPAAKNARCITMQPMRGIEELRQFLRKNEFRIIDERLVLDAGRIYQIIGAKSGDPAPRETTVRKKYWSTLKAKCSAGASRRPCARSATRWASSPLRPYTAICAGWRKQGARESRPRLLQR